MKKYTEEDVKNATAALETLEERHGIELSEDEALEDFASAETAEQVKNGEWAGDFAHDLRVSIEDGDSDDDRQEEDDE